jgi:hypothetical protein
VAARSHSFTKTGSLATGAVQDTVIPAGKTAAITSITFAKTVGGVAVSIYAAIFAPGDATVTYVGYGVFGAAAAPEVIVWTGRVILNAGWTFRVARFSAAGTYSVSAGGFLYDA